MGAGRIRRLCGATLVFAACFQNEVASAAPEAATAEPPPAYGADKAAQAPSESEASTSSTSHELGESWLVPTGHALAVMTGMRLGSAILWPEPFAETDLDAIGASYAAAYTRPPKWDSQARPFEWDGDAWQINVIGHALFGSELYLRPRLCQKQVLPALLFTAAASTTWEYVFEASGVRPSGLDLWYTPLVGILLGEARHVAWSAASRLSHATWRNVLRVIVDPLGEFERAVFSTSC